MMSMVVIVLAAGNCAGFIVVVPVRRIAQL